MIHAIGLMSGTSADGVDAAAVETDGRGRVSCGPWLTVPYDAALRTRLRALDRHDRAAIDDVAAALTDVHAAAVAALSRRLSSPARVIGFHGHTLHHDPARGVTQQIGDAGRLAAACGIDVVADFRSADVAAGGQGAPLAPLYHAALADPLEKPVAILNIGGVANVTYLDREANAIQAFDTGPGNGLLDDWATRHAGVPMDRDGRMAAAGVADTCRLAALMADPYFSRPPPKSLDRDHFAALAARVLEGSAPTRRCGDTGGVHRRRRGAREQALPALSGALVDLRRRSAQSADHAGSWRTYRRCRGPRGDRRLARRRARGAGFRLSRRTQPERPSAQSAANDRRRRAVPRWTEIPREHRRSIRGGELVGPF